MTANKTLKKYGMASILLLSILLLFVYATTDPIPKNTLEENFKNPPIENRPMALWVWLNGYVDTAQLVYELKEMKEKGMQGALIWDLGSLMDKEKTIPSGPAFLGATSLEYISLALKTANALGLHLGMVASSSWNAGGDWITEKDGIKEILSSNQLIQGPSMQKIDLQEPTVNQGQLKVCARMNTIAIPYSESNKINLEVSKPIVLDTYIRDNKYIEWNVPEGKWEILSFFICTTRQELVCPSPNSNGLMIDHLSRKATQLHFDTILSRLNKIGTPGNGLKYMMLDSYEAGTIKDWTPDFIKEFTIRNGYDPKPYLPLLFGYKTTDTSIAKLFLHDYKNVVSDLMIENHFKQSADIGKKNGIKFFAEAGHGGLARVEPLKALGHTDIPMGEFWNRQRHWVTKEAASAAHIYGKKVVASESLTSWQNWQHGPSDYKQLCDIAFCEGLNQVVFHTFTHNPAIAGKPGFAYHAGEHLNVNTTWWKMARPFMDYLSRCSYMLRQGNFVADILYYYGDEAPNLVPPKRLDPNYSPDMPGIFPHWFYDESKCPHCGKPKPINQKLLNGYDYDYINADIITKSLEIKNGSLVLPHGQSYRVMVIPDRTTISLEVLKKLEKLINQGAIIIGPKPETSTSLKNYPASDAEIKIIADKIWGKCDGKTEWSNQYGKGKVYWGIPIENVLHELNSVPDLEVTEIDNSDRHIDYIHRHTENEEIYFISNSNKSIQHFTSVFRVPEHMIPEIWDAESGHIQREVIYSKTNQGTRIDFSLDPLASRFVVFRKKAKSKKDLHPPYDLQFGMYKNKKRIQTLDISMNWKLNFDTALGGPREYKLDTLISWSDILTDGIKYYSGSATYTKDFNLNKEVFTKNEEACINFTDVQELARVYVNGNDCGMLWTPPYRLRITPYLKKGINQITVEAINTWNNRIVGDLRAADQKPFAKTNAKVKFKSTSPLLPSGIIGKTEIVFFTNKP